MTDTRKFRIGSRLFVLAAQALDESMLLALGTPVLERLRDETGEAAHLAVHSHGEVVVIASTAASGLLGLARRSGVTRPAHATAIGKVLLAAKPEDSLERLLASLPMPMLTERTITEPGVLHAELDKVRRIQQAVDDCELDPEARCVAVPVYDLAGRCAAAMGISGPAWRFTPNHVSEGTRQLHAAADQLSIKRGADAAGGIAVGA